MSDTTNRPSASSIMPAATSAEAMAITSAVLGFLLLQLTPIAGFLTGFGAGDDFATDFIGYVIIAALSVLLAVFALSRSAANWVRGAAGAGIVMSVIGVVIVILGKLFS